MKTEKIVLLGTIHILTTVVQFLGCNQRTNLLFHVKTRVNEY